jgi:hypothetical protein
MPWASRGAQSKPPLPRTAFGSIQVWRISTLTPIPNGADILAEDPWKPTPQYRKEFSVSKLFDQPGEVFRGLKRIYGMSSAMASHAGIGALAAHRDGDSSRIAAFLGGDHRQIITHWYTLIAAYMEMFKVFVRMMRANAPTQAIDLLVHDFLQWRDRVAIVHGARAPWAMQIAGAFQDRMQLL